MDVDCCRCACSPGLHYIFRSSYSRSGTLYMSQFPPLISVIGALGIINGLYVVLWGKAKDVKKLKEEQLKQLLISENDQIKTVQVVVNGSNLTEPFLPKENSTF
ncbi:nodulin MtN21 /EamA-like transporter family protein [Artemisia annua]|uniref:Nodulin MtN21 /EamA-like transporter family protein n=1 Tax=Artemisia annua TaxID=35608 RepID=A0A2U1LJV2_ARTAN|nr:nodulin MtN21 /EamA-like transporter family protein [Artemisia annua]